MAKVSVIVPNYNHGPFLERRIQSILNQTYQDFELILLDDCSSDNSRELISRYKDHFKVSHIVLNEQNSGSTFKQWKKGLDLATSELIWLAESDDWAEPTFLEELVAPFVNNPSLCISFCQTLCVDAENNILYKTGSNKLQHVLPGDDFVADRMFYGNSIMNASMAVFNKSKIIEIDWSFTNMKFCGDWFFWVQMALAGEVFESGKYLSYFFKHGKDVTSTATKKGLFFIEGCIIMRYIKENVVMCDKKYLSNINILIKYYLTQKKFFADDTVNKKVLASLRLVDKDIKRLIKQRQYVIKYQQYISKLLYL